MIPILSIDEDDSTKTENLPKLLPLLPLRNNVLFPGVVIPISVGREKSIKAVKNAYKNSKYIGVVAQKDTNNEEPEYKDFISCWYYSKNFEINQHARWRHNDYLARHQEI
jgi:ATP-dependent Lon protease